MNAFDLVGNLFYEEVLLKKGRPRKLSFCERKL
jgi:hypothetical protein